EGPTGEKIQWRYELTFDDDGTGMLCRQTSTSDVNLNFITARFFCPKGTNAPITLTASKMSDRLKVVQAHKDYFRCFYHLPLDMTFNLVGGELEGLGALVALVETADAYDGLELIQVPVERFIAFKIHVIRENIIAYPSILDIASKLKMAWLFRDIVRHIVVQAHWDLVNVRAYFPTKLATLVEGERMELKVMLQGIDYKLLTLQLPCPGHSPWQDSLCLFVREMIIARIKIRDFTRMAQVIDVHHGYTTMHTSSLAASKRDPAVTTKIKNDIEGIIKPLFELSPSIFGGEGTGGQHKMLASPYIKCIQILDEELPWNAAKGEQ
ncbi:MAG: hypothetical protein Q9169_008333, partial [Polycauliona sp. 2 TL-2023]